jgi:hypothetical protein
MVNISPDTVHRAVRIVRIENRPIRSVARNFGFPFSSPTTYCRTGSADDITEIPQIPTFSIGYKNVAR